nr:hypothetical protein 1634Bnrm3_p148 [Cryptomonas sp.]
MNIEKALYQKPDLDYFYSIEGVVILNYNEIANEISLKVFFSRLVKEIYQFEEKLFVWGILELILKNFTVFFCIFI